VDGTGVINISELGDALAVVGLKLPAYEVRDLIRRCDSKIKDDCLDFEEFKVVIVYCLLLLSAVFCYLLLCETFALFAVSEC